METMMGANSPLGLAAILRPVPGTQPIPMPALLCPASWILGTFWFSSLAMTRSSWPLCLHCVIRCFSIYPEPLMLKSRREGKYKWEIKANTAQRRHVTNHICTVQVARDFESDCRDLPAGINMEDIWGGGKIQRPSAHRCQLETKAEVNVIPDLLTKVDD